MISWSYHMWHPKMQLIFPNYNKAPIKGRKKARRIVIGNFAGTDRLLSERVKKDASRSDGSIKKWSPIGDRPRRGNKGRNSVIFPRTNDSCERSERVITRRDDRTAASASSRKTKKYPDWDDVFLGRSIVIFHRDAHILSPEDIYFRPLVVGSREFHTSSSSSLWILVIRSCDVINGTWWWYRKAR